MRGDEWKGPDTSMPPASRAHIIEPTPANLQRIRDNAAANRQASALQQRQTAAITPSVFGNHFGIPMNFAEYMLVLQRRVRSLELKLYALEAKQSPGLPRDVEHRVNHKVSG